MPMAAQFIWHCSHLEKEPKKRTNHTRGSKFFYTDHLSTFRCAEKKNESYKWHYSLYDTVQVFTFRKAEKKNGSYQWQYN